MADEAEEVTLVDEQGAELRFLLHDVFDLEGYAYYLVESAEDPDRVLVLKESAEGALEAVAGPELDRVLAMLESES